MAKRKRKPSRPRAVPSIGGGGFTQKLQELQQQMIDTQAALAEEVVEASAGGGVVTVQMTGQQKLTAITIDPEVVDPDDVEMLQDLILAAVNEAIEKSQNLASERLEGLTGGLNLPGLF